MAIKNQIPTVLLVLALAATACSLPGLQSFQNTPTPLPAPDLPPVEETAEPPQVEVLPTETLAECTSPIEPGVWSGQVQLVSSVSRMGLRVLEQQSVMPLTLQVGCDGSVNGAAARSGEANINVPLALNGVCTESVNYEVTGQVVETSNGPRLDLDFSARQGRLSCNMDSRISAVPSGEQSANLNGYQQQVQAAPSTVSEDRIGGQNWPDRLYQDQLPGLESLIVEAGLNLERSSTWQLELEE
jgi:hypothetical protein